MKMLNKKSNNINKTIVISSPVKKDKALEAIENKHHCLLITGNIFDLQVEPGNNLLYYRPLYLAEKMYEQGKFILRYSRSTGLSIHRYTDLKKEKNLLDDILQRSGLNRFVGNKDIRPTEVVEIFRGFKNIASSKHSIPFVFIVDYIPHLTSGQTADREMQIVAETISDIANLPSVQKAENYLIVYAYEENNLSPLLKVLHRIEYRYPDLEEYEQFFTILQDRDEDFGSTELSPKDAARIVRGLKLNQLASLFKEAKIKGKAVTKNEIIDEKERLIEQISERTLTVLPTDITFDDLAGLETPKRILLDFSSKLSKQDPSSPRAILLAGPPGTGKTTLASAFANAAGFNLVELSDEIKSMWVGQSEARLALALQLIQSLAPVVLFIDEIDQTFSNRTNTSLDGGVSSHYLKTLFNFASRDDLRGKICILGCTNTPQLLDPAMINRFVTIPLLEATPKDMTAIFPKIQKRITGKETLDSNDHNLLQGCELLYKKGASPRQIFDVINHAISKYGENFNIENILESCKSFQANGDPNSGAYSSLSAIRLTAFDDYFPWYKNPDYPLPWYLEGIVNVTDGTVNELELNRKIEELKLRSRY
jgi:SpoVK/Ycf46/Vps4 family AAA+-type ATPase